MAIRCLDERTKEAMKLISQKPRTCVCELTGTWNGGLCTVGAGGAADDSTTLTATAGVVGV